MDAIHVHMLLAQLFYKSLLILLYSKGGAIDNQITWILDSYTFSFFPKWMLIPFHDNWFHSSHPNFWFSGEEH